MVQEKKVEVRVKFIKEAFDSACKEWKRKIIDEFPELDFYKGFRKGVLIKSKTTDLVVLVTLPLIDGYFGGVVVVSDGKYSVGHVSESWCGEKGEIYTGEPIDVTKILGIK